MLSFFVFLIQRIEDDLEMLFIAQEVSIAGIHEQGLHIVLFDIVSIGFLYVEQVVVRNVLLAFEDERNMSLGLEPDLPPKEFKREGATTRLYSSGVLRGARRARVRCSNA